MAKPFDIQSAALLLIDTQRDFLHDDGALARAGMRDIASDDVVPLVDKWNRLAADMSGAGRPVIWLTTAFRRDYTDIATADQWIERRKDIDGGFLVEGSWGAQLMDGLEPAESDYFIGKKGHGAFVGTHLDRLLTNLQVDHCVIAGGSVDDSILETVRTAGILGYQTFLVEDAVYPPRSEGLGFLRKQTEHTSTEEVAALAATTVGGVPSPQPSPRRGGTALLIVDMQNDFLAQDRPLRRLRRLPGGEAPAHHPQHPRAGGRDPRSRLAGGLRQGRAPCRQPRRRAWQGGATHAFAAGWCDARGARHLGRRDRGGAGP